MEADSITGCHKFTSHSSLPKPCPCHYQIRDIQKFTLLRTHLMHDARKEGIRLHRAASSISLANAPLKKSAVPPNSRTPSFLIPRYAIQQHCRNIHAKSQMRLVLADLNDCPIATGPRQLSRHCRPMPRSRNRPGRASGDGVNMREYSWLAADNSVPAPEIARVRSANTSPVTSSTTQTTYKKHLSVMLSL